MSDWYVKKDESTANLRRIPVLLHLDTDRVTPAVGVTAPTIEVSKNGGAQAAGGGSFGEVGDGVYYYELTPGEVDTFGWVNVRVVKSGTSTEFQAIVRVGAYNLYDVNALGLSRLDAAVTSRAAIADYTSTRAARLDNLDALITTRASLAQQDLILSYTDELESRLTAPRATKLDNLDATVATRSSHSVSDVWAYIARTLTSPANLTSDGSEIPIVGGFVRCEVAGMLANTLTAEALAADTVSEIQSGLGTAANQVSLLKLLEADVTVDTATTPWELVYKERGTATELLRKKLRDTAGGNVTATTTVVGRVTQA